MFKYQKIAEIYDVKDPELIKLLQQNGYIIVDGNSEDGDVSCKTLWIVKEKTNEDK